MMSFNIKFLIVIALIFCQPLNVYAQSKNIMRGGPTDPYTRSVSEFFFSRTGSEMLSPVRVVGGVEFPGIYHVPAGTDLATLLSLAGGVATNSDITEISFTRVGEPSKKVNLYEHLEKGREINLVKGDILFVPKKEGIITSETATAITVIVSILSLGLTAYVVDKTID